VCKRNAGRRKLHMRKREQRAKRIMRLLTGMGVTEALGESSYGRLPAIANRLGVSKATASRDLAFCRRIHFQFIQMFGRPLMPRKDRVVWSWDWSHYGFRTSESKAAGNRKPVGKFPFSTRAIPHSEDAFCGLNASSWHGKVEGPDSGDLLSFLRLFKLRTGFPD
jgi:hypothetical protein